MHAHKTTVTLGALGVSVATAGSAWAAGSQSPKVPDGEAHECVLATTKDGAKPQPFTLTLQTAGNGATRTGKAIIVGNGTQHSRDLTLSDPKPAPHDGTRWNYKETGGLECSDFRVDGNGAWRLAGCTGGADGYCKASPKPRIPAPPPDGAQPPAPWADPMDACMSDVVAAFHRIPGDVDENQYLYAHVDGKIQPPRFTRDVSNDFGSDNHFQGAARIPSSYGPYLVVSGDDTHVKDSYLFFIHMASRPAHGPWAVPRGNVMHEGNRVFVPAEDRMETVLRVGDGPYWHVGGFQSWGNLLAVPLEIKGGTQSKIHFFDVRNPKAPKQLPVEIKRENGAAGAAAFARLRNGRFLTAVLDKNVDFYLSKSGNVADGFEPGVRWNINDVRAANGEDADFNGGGHNTDYQSINFIPQCDGKVFLVGFHNDSPLSGAPLPFGDWGSDYADLFRVEFPNGFNATPVLTTVKDHHFDCYDGQCAFSAGTGIYLAGPNHMSVYGVYNFLHDVPAFHFNEYAGRGPR